MKIRKKLDKKLERLPASKSEWQRRLTKAWTTSSGKTKAQEVAVGVAQFEVKLKYSKKATKF